MLDSVLNTKAVQAQTEMLQGADANSCVALWEVKAEFMSLIESLRESIWNFIEDENAFENYCYKKIEQSVRYYNPEHDFRKFCVYQIYGAMKHFKKNRSRTRNVRHMSDMSVPGCLLEFEEFNYDQWEVYQTGYSLEHESAVVHNEAFGHGEVSEMIERYASGDPRREFILSVWAEDGRLADTDLAERLVEVFGGEHNTQRTFLKRFRSQLRDSLAVQA